MIKLILAGLMGLGVFGPIGWLPIKGYESALGHIGWDNSSASVGSVAISKNTLIFDYSNYGGANRFFFFDKDNCHLRFTGGGDVSAKSFGPFEIGELKGLVAFSDNRQRVYGSRESVVFTFNYNIKEGWVGVIGNDEINVYPSALLHPRNIVSLASFVKSSFDQPNTDRAKGHANQRGNTHDFSPPSGDFLRSQILFFAFVFSLGLASLFYTIRLGDLGKADPYYTVFGVLAVYLGALGCLIL